MFPPLIMIPNDTTSYTFNGDNGKSYVFRLWASNEHGESEYTEITGIPGRTPDPPIDVIASFIDKNVSIRWAPPADDGGYQIVRYRIYRNEDGGEFKEIASVNYLTFDHIDLDVEQGVTYEYYITAENVLGRSGRSSSATAFDPIIYSPPSAPEIYLTTKGILYIKIHWRMPLLAGPEITKFIVYREWSEGGPIQNTTIEIDPEEFSYNDTAIVYDVNYTYRVAAVNVIGGSDPSNMITIRVRNLTEPAPNTTTTLKKGNKALIFGLIAGLMILAAAGIVYFVMTKRGPYELPPDEFEIEAEPLSSSIDPNYRGPS